MFVRLNSRVSKAAIYDDVPKEVVKIVVAREYNPFFGLGDSRDSSDKQKTALVIGAYIGVDLLNQGKKVCFVCAAGLSRSVTMACLVAAIWDRTSFQEQFDKMLMRDDWILNPSPVRLLAEHLFPEVVEERINERVQS